jgi:hypothetical protein
MSAQGQRSILFFERVRSITLSYIRSPSQSPGQGKSKMRMIHEIFTDSAWKGETSFLQIFYSLGAAASTTRILRKDGGDPYIREPE